MVEVAGEAQHVAEHVVRNDVGIQPPHVGELAGVLDERGEDVMLQAGGGRLDPAQPACRGQHGRVSLPNRASASVIAARASLSSPALTTTMGRAASTIFARRSGSTAGWTTSLTRRVPPWTQVSPGR